MTKDRATTVLGAFLGIGFILFGLVETGVAIAAQSTIGFFWFPALCGGGALILLGMFRFVPPSRLSLPLVIAGAAMGALATAWTIIIPLLAITLIALAARRPGPAPAYAPAA